MKKVYLDLACGDFYVKTPEWINLDWYPHSRYVRKANLFKEFELDNETFDVIYTSHFLEHIPLDHLDVVLKECFRILKRNGIIRLVVPDLENISREYIHNLDLGDLEKTEFNKIELLDQCVRTKSGRQLAQYRAKENLSEKLCDYITERTVFLFKKMDNSSKTLKSNKYQKLFRLKGMRFQRLYCNLLIKMMPKWFVVNLINFTNTGELLRWVYDENSLTKHLNTCGFKGISRFSAETSQIKDFPFVPLDLHENLRVRKGRESIYMEAL